MSNNNEPLKDRYKRLAKYFIIALVVSVAVKLLTTLLFVAI